MKHNLRIVFEIQVCEHYVARSLCTDFPDWSIAGAGSESLVKIGYEYGRFVTGEELTVDFDQYEEPDQTAPNLQEERTMVAMSAEVCIQFLLRLFKPYCYVTWL